MVTAAVTNEIRIDDLAPPVLNDIQQMGLDYGEQEAHRAHRRRRVRRRGRPHRPRRLRARRLPRPARRCSSPRWTPTPERTGLGRMLMFGDCVRYAANRLRIRDLLRRHPEILDDRRSSGPVIVIGPPPLGHHQPGQPARRRHPLPLDAAVGELRAGAQPERAGRGRRRRPPLDPLPAGVGGDAGRRARSSPPCTRWSPTTSTRRLELHGSRTSRTTTSSGWPGRPQWRDHYLAHDQTPHYAYMKTVLQILQWYRPRERWVLKSPQHLEQIGPLLATFPDATIVVTHRDPVAVVQSTTTMLTYGARTRVPDHPSPSGTATTGPTASAACSTRRCATGTSLPADRTIDVFFHEYMADEMGTLAARLRRAPASSSTDEARAEIDGLPGRPTRGGRTAGSSTTCAATSPPTPDEVRAPLRRLPRPLPRARIEVQ